jgi:hypothetical protein
LATSWGDAPHAVTAAAAMSVITTRTFFIISPPYS